MVLSWLLPTFFVFFFPFFPFFPFLLSTTHAQSFPFHNMVFVSQVSLLSARGSPGIVVKERENTQGKISHSFFFYYKHSYCERKKRKSRL
jgi:hypothetical protein